jgi:xanthine dehydrogenase accessory factor
MRLETLHILNLHRAARRLCALVTPLDGGEPWIVCADQPGAGQPLWKKIQEQLRLARSAVVEEDSRRYFVNVHAPSPRLVIIGAVHVAQALAQMAHLTGLNVVVVDPREAFVTVARFPDAQLIAEWPDVALRGIGLDASTALAVLSHVPKIDDAALVLGLTSDCFYIGALGSKKAHDSRVERLRAVGVGPDQIARVRAPIGLDIGAVSPAEIAVAVLGEVILALGKKPLRARNIG